MQPTHPKIRFFLSEWKSTVLELSQAEPQESCLFHTGSCTKQQCQISISMTRTEERSEKTADTLIGILLATAGQK